MPSHPGWVQELGAGGESSAYRGIDGLAPVRGNRTSRVALAIGSTWLRHMGARAIRTRDSDPRWTNMAEGLSHAAGVQVVSRLSQLSLRTWPFIPRAGPARWSHRRERHPFWELLRHCDFVLVGSALVLSLIGVGDGLFGDTRRAARRRGRPEVLPEASARLAGDRARHHGRGDPDRLPLARTVGLCDLRPRRSRRSWRC